MTVEELDRGQAGDLIIKLVKFGGAASCTRPPAAIDLSDYPCLTIAPEQYGPGVRTATNGVLAFEIADSYARSGDLAAVAAQFGIDPETLMQAVLWAANVRLGTDAEG